MTHVNFGVTKLLIQLPLLKKDAKDKIFKEEMI